MAIDAFQLLFHIVVIASSICTLKINHTNKQVCFAMCCTSFYNKLAWARQFQNVL